METEPISDESDPVHRVEVTRTYLELSATADLGRPAEPLHPMRLERADPCPASFFRYLYAEVGRRYHWTDRLPWTEEEIARHVAREQISIWVLYWAGAPAGYFELERHEDGSTEIAYFGLFEHCIGRGLGKYFLSQAIDRACQAGAGRVWLHTCSLDDPAAMPNYLKRGFRPFKQETYHTFLSPEEMQWYLERASIVQTKTE